MRKILVVVNGLQNKGAQEIAEAIDNSGEFELLQKSLVEDIDSDIEIIRINELPIGVVRQKNKNEILLIEGKVPNVIIDYSPRSVDENIKLYGRARISFLLISDRVNSKYVEERIRNYAGVTAMVASPDEITTDNVLRVIWYLYGTEPKRLTEGNVFPFV